ncbi:hypothetical protein [Acinetobacter venetianus]|uniref:Uncharacterized protein n=1 Tax=Acinetobacter venetianus TaxID=52133 RepID=A0A150HQ81_9GAMM|nr:hypothetical protein [Acinetobacter venetianus]KXZ68752.1 hypothetical protein AVENLUH13518_02912 [Acinetobacter venetianus]
MNFSNIPEGLRTPLFFGEISINGTVPTVSDNGEDPIPPQISCTGATATFKVQHLLKNGIVDVTLLKLFIDGVLWGDDQEVPAWLEITPLEEQYTGEIPLGFDLYHGVVEWKNNDTQNHRIEFKADPTLGRTLMFDNPSVIELGTIFGEHVGVCLSPSTPNIISCIGATSILNLLTSQPTAPLEYEYWRFEVSDAITGQVYSMVNNLNRLEAESLGQSLERLKSVNSPLSFSQTAEPNFFMVIQNTSNQDARIKIKFQKLVQNDEPDVIELFIGDGSTPTLTWGKQVSGEDYEILACLSSNSPSLISCDGATSGAHFLTSPDTYQKQWSVELDGIIYDLAFDAILSDYYMPQEVSDVLHINGDGDWFIENRTSDIHRVRFIPDEDSLPIEPPILDPASNPTIHIDEETGIISFCLAAYPDRIFDYARVDKGETNKLEVHFLGSNIGTIDITDPSGTVTQYTPIANQALVIDYAEGFYTFHSNDGFFGTVGDIYFKASLANQAHPMPVISNVTRDANNIVTIVGTAQTFTVVQIEPDEGILGEALAYAKVLDGETDFTFVLELPPNFSGFIRCRDGNTGSAVASFTI